jgi:hypothetical protein
MHKESEPYQAQSNIENSSFNYRPTHDGSNSKLQHLLIAGYTVPEFVENIKKPRTNLIQLSEFDM